MTGPLSKEAQMTVHTQTSTTESARPRVDVQLGALIGTMLALTATLIIYSVGMVGTPIRVVTGWSPDGANLTVIEVVLTATVSVILGALLLALLQARLRRGYEIWLALIVLVTFGSAVPLFRLDIDLQSKLALSSMHLATGIATIAGQMIAQRAGRRESVPNG